ncbi:ribonuclease H-like domain-containing protein, partial [Tanacetum coccineum]
MKQMYCLVVTNDYSRFSWVFFLDTKDETSGILKSFITGIENLIDQRVKVIRCDNGTEFKNKEMNQFCERKGIKREFSVARTPQQNRVSERKNRILIEAARTMLADAKLPTTFWAEVVNLLSLGFMRPLLGLKDFKLILKVTVAQKVIVNGDSPPPKRTVDGVEQTYPPTTAEEKLAKKNELKARGTLLIALTNEHQQKFNTYKCAKTLMEAIEKSFGEDMNLKFLRILPSEWKTHTLIWRNKPNLDTLSIDDLYNNMNIYETKVKGSSISNQNSQNVAFVSSNNSGSSNQAYGSNSTNTDSMSDVVIYSFFANQSNSLQLNDEDIQQIDADDLEEMDLKWQMAMLTMRARRFLNKTGKNINANGSETIGFNKSKVECYNCHKKGHFAREYRAPRENRNKEPIRRNMTVETTKTKALVAQDGLGYYWRAYKAFLESVEARLDVYKKNEVIFEEDIKILKLDIKLRDNALTELRKKFEKSKKERDDLKLTLENFENSSKNLSKLLDSQVCDKFKTGVGFDSQVVDSQVFDSQENDRYKTSEGYHAVFPPYTRNFMPLKSDLVLADKDEYVFSESVTSIPDVATSKAKTSVLKPKYVSEPLNEDWISDSEDENETEFKTKQRKPSFAKVEFVKSKDHVKTPREYVKEVENNKQAKYPRKNSQSPRGNQRNWNNLMTQKLGSNFEFKNKACYVCVSFNHLIKDCDFHEKKMVEKPVWNNASQVNHQNSHRLTHPHPKINFVPGEVLMKSGLKTLNTAWQNSSRVAGNVTTTGPKAVVSDEANAVKASTCWVWRPKQKVLDHVSRHNGASMNFKRFNYVDAQGRSKHMTGNKSYLSNYKEIDGGFVAFGRDPKGGRITGKGKISTDTECVVLSPDFKLLDENHVLLRVPRKDNCRSKVLDMISL